MISSRVQPRGATQRPVAGETFGLDFAGPGRRVGRVPCRRTWAPAARRQGTRGNPFATRTGWLVVVTFGSFQDSPDSDPLRNAPHATPADFSTPPPSLPRPRSVPRAWSAGSAGANSDVRVAVIGLNGRGKNHLRRASSAGAKGVRIAAICDVDTAVLRAGRGGAGQGRNHAAPVHRPARVAGRTRTSMPSRSPRPTTGTPWRESGPAPPARIVYVEETRFRTTSWEGQPARGRRPEIQPGRAGGRPDPLGRGFAGGGAVGPRRKSGPDHGVARLLLQAPQEHRPQHRSDSAPGDRELRPVARARRPARRPTGAAVPLRLALVQHLRERRRRQPGHPPDGRGAMVSRRPGTAPPHAQRVGGPAAGYVDDGETRRNTQIVVCARLRREAPLVSRSARPAGGLWIPTEGQHGAVQR